MEDQHRIAVLNDDEGQFLRIPKELEISESEVVVTREDDTLLLRPIKKKKPLREVLATLEPIDEEFPEIDDPPPEPVKI